MAEDGGWGWMVVVGSCICHFFTFGIYRSSGIFFVLLQERFESSATDTALVNSITTSVVAFGGDLFQFSVQFSCRTYVSDNIKIMTAALTRSSYT